MEMSKMRFEADKDMEKKQETATARIHDQTLKPKGIWVRKENCGCCGGQLIYDERERTVSCGCTTLKVPRIPQEVLNAHYLKLESGSHAPKRKHASA
jgi:hypothetical protein